MCERGQVATGDSVWGPTEGRSRIVSFFVVLAAVFFGVMGVLSMYRPEALPDALGSTNQSADERNEVRAVYGGFGIAIAALLIWTLTDDTHSSGIYLTVSTALIGMAAGRIVDVLVDRERPWIWPTAFFFAAEVAFAAMLFGAR